MKKHGIVAVIKKGNRYLLLKDSRKLMLDHWAPPHGRCSDDDKTEEETVIREVMEETSLKVKPLKKLWTTEADTKVDTVSFWLADIIAGDIKISEDETSEFGWFTLDECLKLKLYPGTKKFFNMVKNKKIIL